MSPHHRCSQPLEASVSSKENGLTIGRSSQLVCRALRTWQCPAWAGQQLHGDGKTLDTMGVAPAQMTEHKAQSPWDGQDGWWECVWRGAGGKPNEAW